MKPKTVAIIGAGPAGLMAADVLAHAGVRVNIYDAMPSVGRKFLLAGVGGMNITHAEPFEPFVERYREAAPVLKSWLEAFGADHLREFIHKLGINTFVGSSGRVFPEDMKAAPLLRAWLKRLREMGVEIHTRHRWQGFEERQLSFLTPHGNTHATADAVVLALGGGSWARLGSDGAWVPWLRERGVTVRDLRAANCGFEIDGLSDLIKEKFAGSPVKTVSAWTQHTPARRGEFIFTDKGVEGSLIYALSAPLREQLEAQGSATLYVDLLPQLSADKVLEALNKPRGSRSMAKHLQAQLHLEGVKAALLREFTCKNTFANNELLATAIKTLAITVHRTRPLDEAISSAGGIMLDQLTEHLMLKKCPGVFAAGEMLDWEAPTGGYLLTACFSSGVLAAKGVRHWLGHV